jgi:hypothetical protein
MAGNAIEPVGVATETYYRIVNILQTDCQNKRGWFMEARYHTFTDDQYMPNNSSVAELKNFNMCNINDTRKSITVWDNRDENVDFKRLFNDYDMKPNENMCPKNYGAEVDVPSWGACNCWENGGRRSDNGNLNICGPGTSTTATTARAWADIGDGRVRQEKRVCPTDTPCKDECPTVASCKNECTTQSCRDECANNSCDCIEGTCISPNNMCINNCYPKLPIFRF